VDGGQTHLDLAAIDVDGALAETAVVLPVSTRRRFLGGALAGGVGLLTGLTEASIAEAAVATAKRDISILRFDLVLEYLQAGLYTEAERLGALKPTTLGWARVVGAHERAHAKAIKALLGRHAVPSPSFNYRGVTQDEQAFIKTAVAFIRSTRFLASRPKTSANRNPSYTG